MSVSEFYNRSVRPLPASDRLRLAKLILDDIPPQSLVDYSEEWTDEDLDEFRNAVAQDIDQQMGDAPDAQTR